MSSRAGRAACTVLGITLLGAALTGCGAADIDTSTRDGSGNITEAGEVGVLKLRVGDCLPATALGDAPEPTESDSPERSEVESLSAVPCTDPHVAEVVLVDDDFFADESKLPSDEALAASGEQLCTPAIEDYTGEDYDTSSYGTYSLTPTLDSWALGDRGAVCVAVSFDEEFVGYQELTRSIKA